MMLMGLLAGTFYIGDVMSSATTLSDLSAHTSRPLSSLSKPYLGTGYGHALLKSLHTIQEAMVLMPYMFFGTRTAFTATCCMKCCKKIRRHGKN